MFVEIIIFIIISLFIKYNLQKGTHGLTRWQRQRRRKAQRKEEEEEGVRRDGHVEAETVYRLSFLYTRRAFHSSFLRFLLIVVTIINKSSCVQWRWREREKRKKEKTRKHFFSAVMQMKKKEKKKKERANKCRTAVQRVKNDYHGWSIGVLCVCI